ncbi:hypothetical protein AX15_003769 [Amanita polypyramis BW_CC]|nr:hypothetical protein AX15_003769 [Amanita polypyramis BW_CC]
MEVSELPLLMYVTSCLPGGKSAVLSAITVALGGKANSTGRGAGLKSFIREGQSVAEVTVTIKNQGEEAYKPNEYGKSIVITRRFTKEGTSTWKIKSKDGRVISSKREELSTICDHMNIQVDNPLNVLTQDAARQFLSSSHPSDKYKFFLKGTQLAQLSEEYDVCLENISQTTKILNRKRQALPDLDTAFREALARYEEAEKAREQRKKADDIEKELAWAHVKTKELEVAEKAEAQIKAEGKLSKVERQLAETRAAFDVATDEVARLEGDYHALGNTDGPNSRKKELQEIIRENKRQIQSINSDAKDMDASMTNLGVQIKRFDQEIKAEERRLEKHTQVRREETLRKLEEAEKAMTMVEEQKKQLAEQYRKLEEEATGLRNAGREDERKVNELKSQVQRSQEIIEQCKRKENDKYVPYGNNIKALLDQIGKMRWAGEVPLGPLGLYVNCKDPGKWGSILRYQLGQYLTAFAVTDGRDRPILKKLLTEAGNPNTLIVIYEKDLFDFSRGELPENISTVHRALEVSDPYVLRILINLAGIERIVLSETRRDGDNLLRNQELNGGSAWTGDGFLVRVYPDGGISSIRLDNMGKANPLLLTGRDTAGEVQHYTQELRNIEAELVAVNASLIQKRQDYNQRQATIEQIRRKLQATEEIIRNTRNSRNALQQELHDDMPANIVGIQEAKQEIEKEQESIKNQFQEAMQRKAELGRRNSEHLMELNEISKQSNQFYEQQRIVKTLIEEAAETRVRRQGEISHYERKLEEETRNIRIAEGASQVVQEEYRNWRKDALKFCEPIENPRKADKLQMILESVKNALKEREKRHGATVEDMAAEVNKAKARYETADKEVKQMSALNRTLKKSLTMRLARWQEFRRHIALRCKLVFQYNLSHRGYFGKILFNHENQSLQLKVQTDDQIATQGNRDKDPRSLSGGEKSFSTICLLLSLWESIGCPLRCLDEFDVFMDPINRRVSMRMMIESAQGSDKKQYILITPQDMTSITPSNAVRVLRMSDPERGQGVLRFGS